MDDKLLDRLKNDLFFLQQLGPDGVSAVCDVALTNVISNLGGTVLTSNQISEKLNVGKKQVESASMALLCLFFEAARDEISAEQLRDSLSSLNLEDSVLTTIGKCYENGAKIINDGLKLNNIGFPRFVGLQWRLESQLGSRSRLHCLQPRAVLRLDLEKEGKSESVTLVLDIPNAVRWSRKLEDAIAESRTPHARRVRKMVN